MNIQRHVKRGKILRPDCGLEAVEKQDHIKNMSRVLLLA